MVCLVLLASGFSTAGAALRSVHAGRDRVWQLERARGDALTRYLWFADRHSETRSARWLIAAVWWHRATLEAAKPLRTAPTGLPGWFYGWAACISQHEEYGETGPNTVAGYFGMVYPPSSYPGGYGSSWLDLNLAEQLPIVYRTLLQDGAGAWSTSVYCG